MNQSKIVSISHIIQISYWSIWFIGFFAATVALASLGIIFDAAPVGIASIFTFLLACAFGCMTHSIYKKTRATIIVALVLLILMLVLTMGGIFYFYVKTKIDAGTIEQILVNIDDKAFEKFNVDRVQVVEVIQHILVGARKFIVIYGSLEMTILLAVTVSGFILENHVRTAYQRIDNADYEMSPKI